MTVTFVAPMRELRSALVAVLPHVDTDPDGPPQLGQLRVTVSQDAGLVEATDRHTAGVATFLIEEFHSDLDQHRPGIAETFRLLPEQAKHIAELFRPGRAGTEWTLTVLVESRRLTVTDTSGLIQGEQLTTPLEPLDEKFPDVARIVQRRLMSALAGDRRPAIGIGTRAMPRFLAAARTYAAPLDIWPQPGGALIRAGDAFVGVAAAASNGAGGADAGSMRERDIATWIDRIGRMTPTSRAVQAGVVDLATAVGVHFDTPDTKETT